MQFRSGMVWFSCNTCNLTERKLQAQSRNVKTRVINFSSSYVCICYWHAEFIRNMYVECINTWVCKITQFDNWHKFYLKYSFSFSLSKSLNQKETALQNNIKQTYAESKLEIPIFLKLLPRINIDHLAINIDINQIWNDLNAIC